MSARLTRRAIRSPESDFKVGERRADAIGGAHRKMLVPAHTLFTSQWPPCLRRGYGGEGTSGELRDVNARDSPTRGRRPPAPHP